MKLVEFLPEAEAEHEEAIAFYESERKGVGLRFQTAVAAAIRVLQADPERPPMLARSKCRRVRLKKFPYHLVYAVLRDRIRIIAVAHQKRKPGYWKDRPMP